MLKNDLAAFVAERLVTDIEFYEMVQQELDALRDDIDRYFDDVAAAAAASEDEVLDQYNAYRRF